MKLLAIFLISICISFTAQADLLGDYKAGNTSGYPLIEDAQSTVEVFKGSSGEQGRRCYLADRYDSAVGHLSDFIDDIEAKELRLIGSTWYRLSPSAVDTKTGILEITPDQLDLFKDELKTLERAFRKADRRCS